MTKEIVVFLEVPTYEAWCEVNSLDPDNDENYNAYAEWKANL